MKKYIGMAWPSDGLNDSEYWKLIPKNIELLIARYPVSGSLNLIDLKKEANLSNIYKVIKKLHVKKLSSLILCDFASSILNENYISKSELFFKTKLNIPCLNIVSSTIKFISNRKKKITIISPYSENITKIFLKFLFIILIYDFNSILNDKQRRRIDFDIQRLFNFFFKI